MSGSVPIARRNILADRRHLVISVLGVGAAIALILLLQGLWSGFRVQISAYEDNVGADLFVGEPGTQNFFGVPSVLPAENVSTIRGTPGVDRADPIAVRFAVLDLHGRKQFVFLVGSEPGGMGGPWDVASGRPVREDDEVVVDRTLADQHGIGIGDRIVVMGEPFRVVGLSTGTRSWMASFVFTSHEAIERLLSMPGTTSFVLVRTGEPAAVAEAIREETGLTVLSPRELGGNDRALLGKVMDGPLTLMLLIAFAAGTLIVALTVYSAIVERIREYGIVKAMGARRGRLFRIVLGQTFIVTALGTAAGYLLFRGASWLVGTLRPQMWVRQSVAGVGGAIAAAVLMAVLAAVVPTRRIARLDPASVYRG
ncbi:MAG: ABC transporter permease [Actinobacteria bacterium]|nr:ABC transporter permease [Actinomycetota bacterium]